MHLVVAPAAAGAGCNGKLESVCSLDKNCKWELQGGMTGGNAPPPPAVEKCYNPSSMAGGSMAGGTGQDVCTSKEKRAACLTDSNGVCEWVPPENPPQSKCFTREKVRVSRAFGRVTTASSLSPLCARAHTHSPTHTGTQAAPSTQAPHSATCFFFLAPIFILYVPCQHSAISPTATLLLGAGHLTPGRQLLFASFHYRSAPTRN